MGLFSFLSGGGGIKEALNRNAVIIDVRTAAEFDRGRVPGSINIPLDRLAVNTRRIKEMNRPVIVCCSSGSRSSTARQQLKEAGIRDVYNGGSWESVLRKINHL